METQRLLASTLLLVSCFAYSADEPTTLELMLHDYFDTGSVCATAEVVSIKEENSMATIFLDIESGTSRSLTHMDSNARDDWFSLHCPPEFHPVWKERKNLDDIQVNALLADNTAYTLSCLQYQEQMNQRMTAARTRVRTRLDILLGR